MVTPHTASIFVARRTFSLLSVPAASQDTSNNRIRKIDLKSGETTTLAGSSKGSNNGVGTSAQFSKPMGIAIDPKGAFALVAVRAWPAFPRLALPPTAHPPSTHAPRPHRSFVRRQLPPRITRLAPRVHRAHALCTCISGPQ